MDLEIATPTAATRAASKLQAPPTAPNVSEGASDVRPATPTPASTAGKNGSSAREPAATAQLVARPAPQPPPAKAAPQVSSWPTLSASPFPTSASVSAPPESAANVSEDTLSTPRPTPALPIWPATLVPPVQSVLRATPYLVESAHPALLAPIAWPAAPLILAPASSATQGSTLTLPMSVKHAAPTALPVIKLLSAPWPQPVIMLSSPLKKLTAELSLSATPPAPPASTTPTSASRASPATLSSAPSADKTST